MKEFLSDIKQYASAKRKSAALQTEIASQKVANKWLRDITGNPARTQGVLGQANFVTRAIGRAESRRRKS